MPVVLSAVVARAEDIGSTGAAESPSVPHSESDQVQSSHFALGLGLAGSTVVVRASSVSLQAGSRF